jgi:hypothetical protein
MTLGDGLLDLLLAPGLWLALLVTVLSSTLFSSWLGGGLGQWGRDLLAGSVGFAMGQLVANALGVTWLRFGEVQFLGGMVGCLAGVSLMRVVLGRAHRNG